jgi:hypothetical protein
LIYLGAMAVNVEHGTFSQRQTRYFKLARNFYFCSIKEILTACGLLGGRERVAVTGRIMHEGLETAGVVLLTDERLVVIVSHNLKPWVLDIPREYISSFTCDGDRDACAISLMYAAPHGVTETRLRACASQAVVDPGETLAAVAASRATSMLTGLLGRKVHTDAHNTRALYEALEGHLTAPAAAPATRLAG